MVKRSPRYPRHNLPKSIEMIRKLFAGAHQAKIDVDSAANVIGYSSSNSGAAAAALGALRQFGLVDGLRGDMGVSDLAMRILQPMDEQERVDALHEAAMKPEIFGTIINQFGGRLPAADEPIRAFLIRQESFSAGGAEELIQVLRETTAALPEKASGAVPKASSDEKMEGATKTEIQAGASPSLVAAPADASGELITLPLGAGCKAELRLIGDVTVASYERLIRHLELLRDIAVEDDEA